MENLSQLRKQLGKSTLVYTDMRVKWYS